MKTRARRATSDEAKNGVYSRSQALTSLDFSQHGALPTLVLTLLANLKEAILDVLLMGGHG